MCVNGVLGGTGSFISNLPIYPVVSFKKQVSTEMEIVVGSDTHCISTFYSYLAITFAGEGLPAPTRPLGVSRCDGSCV